MKLLLKLSNRLTAWIYQLSLKAHKMETYIAKKRIKALTKLSYELRAVIMKIEKEKNELEKTYNL